MYRRLSEARNPACIRGTACRPPRFRPPLRLRQVPSALAPLQRGGRCLDQIPIIPQCPLIAGVPASTGPPSAVGPAASTGALCAPAPSGYGVWRLFGCPVCFSRRRPSSLPPARKPRAAVPSAHGSMSTPLFFVEKTAGSSAWSSDMVGRTAWVPPDGQTAPPATLKLELSSNLTRRGCTKTYLFWPAETTNLSHHSLLAPCGLCRDRFPRLSPARSPTDLILPDRSTRLTMVFGFLSLLFHRADSLQQLRQTWARF